MSNEEIKIVVNLFNEGNSARSIARTLGRHVSSVILWLKRYQESATQKTPVREKRSGAPRKTSRIAYYILK